MIGRIVGMVAAFCGAGVLITLAVANRHAVPLVLDPFNPQRPVISVELPFYAYLFAAMIGGVVMGGVATWLAQGKWRRMARVKTQDAVRAKAETDRLIRERDAGLLDKARTDKTAQDRRQLAVVHS